MNDNICDKIFINFLIRAKKSTYANSTIEKVASSMVGSSTKARKKICEHLINKLQIYKENINE